MLRSMTGFAAKTLTIASTDVKTNISISLKSLNSRFFESTCKLHHQLNSLEVDLTKLLKDRLHRGHVYLTMYVSNHDLFKGSVEPSLHTIDGYMKAIATIKEKYPLQGALDLGDLLMLPHVFTMEEKSVDDSLKKLLITTTSDLINEVIHAQEQEGIALQTDLAKRIAIMQQELMTIEQASALLIGIQKDKIAKNLQEVSLNESTLVDIQKHAAYALLDKMDINEEIVRFKSHLKNLTTTLASADIEKGKRLDFTLQEMAREINTIAAKCSDATISGLAINIKVELEKAREQTQNIV